MSSIDRMIKRARRNSAAIPALALKAAEYATCTRRMRRAERKLILQDLAALITLNAPVMRKLQNPYTVIRPSVSVSHAVIRGRIDFLVCYETGATLTIVELKTSDMDSVDPAWLRQLLLYTQLVRAARAQTKYTLRPVLWLARRGVAVKVAPAPNDIEKLKTHPPARVGRLARKATSLLDEHFILSACNSVDVALGNFPVLAPCMCSAHKILIGNAFERAARFILLDPYAPVSLTRMTLLL